VVNMTNNYELTNHLARTRQQDLIRAASIGRFARIARRHRRARAAGSTTITSSRDASHVPLATVPPVTPTKPSTAPVYGTKPA
jgi:hypothetical protein